MAEHVTPIEDWDVYVDPAMLPDVLAANPTASVVIGVINNVIEIVGLTLSFDDPTGTLGRVHALSILDWQPVEPQPAAFPCETDNYGAYRDCMEQAANKYYTCRWLADQTFDDCVRNVLVAAFGASITCVISKLLGTTGPVNRAFIQAVLAGCFILGLVGAVGGLWLCYSNRDGAYRSCTEMYRMDVNGCRRMCRQEAASDQPS